MATKVHYMRYNREGYANISDRWRPSISTYPVEPRDIEVLISDGVTVKVSAMFKESEKGRVMPNEYTNTFTVTVTNSSIKESFDFHESVNDAQQNKLRMTNDDAVFALYCFVSDAISGAMAFQDFKSEFGYDDCCEAHRIWKQCKEATIQAARLGLGNLYDVANFIQEKYPGAM